MTVSFVLTKLVLRCHTAAVARLPAHMGAFKTVKTKQAASPLRSLNVVSGPKPASPVDTRLSLSNDLRRNVSQSRSPFVCSFAALCFLHVVADGVWQDDHAPLALLQLFGQVHRCSHGRPGAASCRGANREKLVSHAVAAAERMNAVDCLRVGPRTAQQALLSDQHAGHVEGVLVVGLVPDVHHLRTCKNQAAAR